MSKVSLASAYFAGVFMQYTMYGIFVVLFIAACYAQWDKSSRGGGVNYVMAFAAVLFGFTVTADYILALCQTTRVILQTNSGMSLSESLGPPYPVEEVTRIAMFRFQMVFAEGIMVYRMYHIYDRNPFVCIVPSITTAASFAVACGLANQMRDLTTPRKREAQQNWTTACFCITIFNSLFTTVGISFRLWRVHRETAKANLQTRGSVVLRAMKVLIESAALWTTFVVAGFITFIAKSNLSQFFFKTICPVTGISFCLIIVRFGNILPKARDEAWDLTARTPISQLSSPVSFAQVKVQRDVFVEGSRNYPVESSDSKMQEYDDSSSDLPDAPHASFNLPTSV